MAAETIPVDTQQPKRLFVASRDKEYFTIHNNGTGTLYVLVDGGQSPSATNYTVPMAASSYYESPLALQRGQEVWGIWAAGATGFAQVQSWESDR